MLRFGMTTPSLEEIDMAWVNTSPLVKTYTLDEFWRLPEPPDRSKLELIAGVLYVTPPPDWPHDRLVARLNELLSAHLRTNGIQGTLYVPRAAIWTGPGTYLEPDLFYVSAELEARIDPGHRTTADLVIEVVSPGSAIYDRNAKADTYAALGVKEMWLVEESQKRVEVRNQTGNSFGERRVFTADERIVCAVLPNVNILPAQLFSD